MGHQQHGPRAGVVIARDELRSGVVVSTVRLPGDAGFESMAFSPGWPGTSDAIAAVRSRYLFEALSAHRALLERYTAEEPDTTDPGWVYRLLGLPPRRYPKGRP